MSRATSKPANTTAAEPNAVTGRAFAVLDTFDSKHRRQTLAQMSRRSGLPLTTTHRLVHELERNAALVRRVDGAYEIGSKLWRLGLLASVHSDLRELALPYMEDVYQFGSGAVQVAVLDGVRCLIVERIAGSRTLAVLSKPGERLPLHATGVGKVLLAFGSDELQQAVLSSLDRYTENTVTDPTVLRRQLRTIRQHGVAETGEELAMGATSIAVPIRGNGNQVIAAMGMIAPAGTGSLARIIPTLQVSAAALSKRMIASGLGDSPTPGE